MYRKLDEPPGFVKDDHRGGSACEKLTDDHKDQR